MRPSGIRKVFFIHHHRHRGGQAEALMRVVMAAMGTHIREGCAGAGKDEKTPPAAVRFHLQQRSNRRRQRPNSQWAGCPRSTEKVLDVYGYFTSTTTVVTAAMSTLYPSINAVLARTPESTLLVHPRQAKQAQRQHEQKEHAAAATLGAAAAPHAQNEDKDERDYASLFPMSFGSDEDWDEEDGKPTYTQSSCCTSAHREAGPDPSGLLALRSPPPPYTRSVRDDEARVWRFHGALVRKSQQPQPQPPLVLELLVGHRLAHKVAHRRMQRRAAQLDEIHHKWARLGVDTRSIVAAAARQSRRQSAGSYDGEGDGDICIGKDNGVAREGTGAVAAVAHAKHCLPPHFWEPPNYGPDEMDRRLRALGL